MDKLLLLHTRFMNAKRRLLSGETGATAVEYGLLVGLIAVAIIAVLVILGPQLAAIFQGVSDKLPAAPAAPAAG